MKKFIVAVAFITLGACGSEKSGTIEGEDGTEGSYTVKQDGDEANVTIRTDEGTLNVQSGAAVAVELPAGYSVYPGARVVTNTKAVQGDELMTIVGMESSASAAEMTAFYRRQAEAAGIKIAMEMESGDGTMISGEGANGAMFTFASSKTDDATSGQLMVGTGQ
jgi:hypothetical protein